MSVTKGNILIVEDDLNLGFLLMDLLQNEGYRVRIGRDGKSGLELLRREVYDLCIFDVMMPKMDGYNLSKHLKDIQPATPFLFLTAKLLKEDKIKGYDLGAEDYVVKPFDDEELLCKINVILRRRKGLLQKSVQTQHQIGKYSFNCDTMELSINGNTIRITEKENKVLQLLCLHKNRILRREEAVEKIYGKYDYFLGRSFDVYISRIRKLLRQDPQVSVDNVFKVGFILNTGSRLTSNN